MKTLEKKKMAIKNSLTDKEMIEIENNFGNKNIPFLTIQQVLEMEKNKQLQLAN